MLSLYLENMHLTTRTDQPLYMAMMEVYFDYGKQFVESKGPKIYFTKGYSPIRSRMYGCSKFMDLLIQR